MFVPLCFSGRNVLITSGTYECSYNQRNYLVFWKSVPMADVCDRRSNLTNTTLAEPPLLAARTYAGGLRRARLLASLSFLSRRAPCRGRGEGVCSVLARVANPATTHVCRHRVAQIGPEMPTILL